MTNVLHTTKEFYILNILPSDYPIVLGGPSLFFTFLVYISNKNALHY